VYTIILSTYTKEMLGRYACAMQASVSTLGLAEIPPEGQSGYKMAIRGEWKYEDGTAAGCNNHGKYDKNPIYVLTIPTPSSSRSVTVTARLAAVSNHSVASLNLSFYELTNIAAGSLLPVRANPKTAVHTSCGGVYSGRATGVVCDGIELTPGQWAMVPSTFDPTPETFDIHLSFSISTKVDVQRRQ
jgi:hypothetical protein